MNIVNDLLAERRIELEREIARLRSIVHRAESHILSYDTRGAISILRELNEGEDEANQ